MSDDIAARLRAWIPCYRADTDIAVDMAKAADEIERLHQLVGETDKLRTELADAKRQLSQHALDRLALLDERIGLE